MVLTVSAMAEGLRNLPPATEGNRIEITDRVWATTPGEASVCVWKDDRLAAVSFTIDDNWKADHQWWLDITEKYGFKVTWFIVTTAIERNPGFAGTWDDWKKILDAGHEVQSHTVTHRGIGDNMPLDEDYGDSIRIIEENLPGNRVRVLAFPGGGLENDPEIAAKYFIGARGTVGHINTPGNINYMQTASLGGGITLDEHLPDGRRQWAYTPDTINPENKKFFRGWTCTHMHGVSNWEGGAEHLEKQFKYLKEKGDAYWVAPFGEVVQYGQQRDTATLKVTKNTDKEIAIDLTSKMDPKYFDFPLTVKVCVPKDWKKVAATQDGKEIESKLVEHEGHKYAFVQIVSGRGEAKLVP